MIGNIYLEYLGKSHEISETKKDFVILKGGWYLRRI